MGCGHSKQQKKRASSPTSLSSPHANVEQIDIMTKTPLTQFSSRGLRTIKKPAPLETYLSLLKEYTKDGNDVMYDSDPDESLPLINPQDESTHFFGSMHNTDDETRLAKAKNMFEQQGFFQECSDIMIMTFLRALAFERIPSHKILIRQGDQVNSASRMYLLFAGEVNVEISGGNRRLIKKSGGWIFGEIALICQSNRTATVSTAKECELYHCSRKALMILPLAKGVLFLRRLPLLQVMSDNNIFDLYWKSSGCSFQVGQTIIKYGDLNDTNVYLIRHGKVAIQKPSPTGRTMHLATATRGQLLGQRMVITGKMRSADCVAISNVDALAISARDFAMIDTPILSGWLDYDAITSVLKTTGDLKSLDEIALDDLIEESERLTFASGTKIFDEGEEIQGLYIVRSGSIVLNSPRNNPNLIRSDSNVMRLKDGGGFTFFGDMSAIFLTDQSVFAERDTVMLRLTFKNISSTSSSEDAYENNINQVPFEELVFERVIGIGNSGRVYLVIHRKSKQVYALKAMEKLKIRHAKQVQHTKNELDILKSLHHPFCTKFVGAYQDNIWLYILQEYLPGGEFFSYLQDHPSLSEKDCQFYAANVLLALEHIHHHSMIYRDLKPENLLLDTEGFIKIADFGFAKKMKAGLRTFTICGTPAYQAPEIISRKGTGKEADIWSLGILIYEMQFGETPFESADADPMQTYKLAGSGRFTVPKSASLELKDLLYKILTVDPLKRPTLQNIKEHKWFKNMNWEVLLQRKITPPFKPTIKSSDDTNNFDDFTGQLPPDPNPNEPLPFPNEKWSDFANLTDFF